MQQGVFLSFLRRQWSKGHSCFFLVFNDATQGNLGNNGARGILVLVFIFYGATKENPGKSGVRVVFLYQRIIGGSSHET